MEVYPNRPLIVLVGKFYKKDVWIQKNMLIGIGIEPPDCIVNLTGYPDGWKKESEKKEKG